MKSPCTFCRAESVATWIDVRVPRLPLRLLLCNRCRQSIRDLIDLEKAGHSDNIAILILGNAPPDSPAQEKPAQEKIADLYHAVGIDGSAAIERTQSQVQDLKAIDAKATSLRNILHPPPPPEQLPD